MSKFIKRFDSTYADISADLHEQEDWDVGELRHFEFAQELSAIAVDPVSGLLAAGTQATPEQAGGTHRTGFRNSPRQPTLIWKAWCRARFACPRPCWGQISANIAVQFQSCMRRYACAHAWNPVSLLTPA